MFENQKNKNKDWFLREVLGKIMELEFNKLAKGWLTFSLKRLNKRAIYVN